MKNFDFHQLDDIIHSKIRLGIMTVLTAAGEAGFSELKKLLKISDGNLSLNIKKIEQAAFVGKLLAAKCKEKGIENVTFDRGGYKYHGRVKSLADAAREGGLKF